MKNAISILTLSLAFCSTYPVAAHAEAVVGQQAPPFSETDANGKTHSLKDYQGKWVVLEWYNKDCPFVKKHYGSDNMQSLQKKYRDKGVVWLSVISSAKGKEGYMEPKDTLKNAEKVKSNATAILRDSDGTMGKAYGATTTPHMFVINPKGVVIYAGAIDNKSSANPKVIPESTNFVAAALDAAMAPGEEAMSGKTVATKSWPSYGCSVKY